MQAVKDVKSKDHEKVEKEIDQLAEKSKRAYVRLYERVGEEIGMHFLDKLENGGVGSALGAHGQSEYDRVMK